jgi:cardiolipin synthase
LWIGCRQETSPSAGDGPLPQPDGDLCSPTSPRSVPVNVSVLPEDGEKPFVDMIGRATQSLRVFAYLMGTGGILDGLVQQAQAGLDVRVILDAGQTANQTYYNQLKAAGAKLAWSDPQFTHMHAKVIIGDDKEAVVSTGNYSLTYSIQRNRDYVGHTTDPKDVADLIQLFDTDWDRKAPSLPCTRLLVSPINARLRLVQLINSAQSTLDLESMQFADTEVREAVGDRKRDGVSVRAILADASWVDANSDAAAYLKGLGIPVRYLKTPGVHAKAIMVDGTQAYLGSVNLSYTSLSKNREVGIVVTAGPALQRMSATFDKDWAAATPF